RLRGSGAGHLAMLAWSARATCGGCPWRLHFPSFVPPFSQRDGGVPQPGSPRGPCPRRNQPDQVPLSVMKTFTAQTGTVQRDRGVVDAAGQALGRLAAELAHRLRGKHEPVYAPHDDTGDYIIVVDAEKIAVTGNKLANKKYLRFAGY